MLGNVSLMLHAHMPYCKKSGVWPAGEEWLFEAMNETYIPLLRIFRDFQRNNLKPRIMLGVVPILAEQLSDAYMINRYCEYTEDKIDRAQKDVERFRDQPKKQEVARFWMDFYQGMYEAFTTQFHKDVMGTVKWLHEEGVIEALTSAATHGFLPLLERDSGIYSQIELGVQTYEKYIGTKPRGFWLPECAYRPREWSDKLHKERRSLDEWLADAGIDYFFVEDVGITSANFVENKYNEEHPVLYRGHKLESGVCVFGRNQITGKQV